MGLFLNFLMNKIYWDVFFATRLYLFAGMCIVLFIASFFVPEMYPYVKILLFVLFAAFIVSPIVLKIPLLLSLLGIGCFLNHQPLA